MTDRTNLAAALLRDAIISGMRIATETPIEQVPAAIADVLAALSADQIDKAEALRIVMEECYKDREMKLATRIAERLAAIPARGVGMPADVRDYAIKVSEAYDTMMEVQRNPAGAWQVIQALAGHIAALAPTDAAQAREAALREAADAIPNCGQCGAQKTILALIGEDRT